MDDGFLAHVGRLKLGNPEGYSFFRFERIGPDANKLTAGRVGVHSKGKKKGQPCWEKPWLEVVVTDTEKHAAESAYESQTGRCARCLGDGEVVGGWSVERGKWTVPCRPCNGTGVAVA